MTEAELIDSILAIMRETLKGARNLTSISRSSTANDVPGWDSLSHAILILNIESEFNIELPLEKTLELQNVGDLADLIHQLMSD
jgi:acyl carrier protein